MKSSNLKLTKNKLSQNLCGIPRKGFHASYRLYEEYYVQIRQTKLLLRKLQSGNVFGFQKQKKFPKCKSNLIPLNCSQEEFQEYSPEEKEIIIESSLLQERTKNKHLQCAIKNPKLSPEEQIQKIANDVTVIKWSILGFAGICVLIYLFEEFL